MRGEARFLEQAVQCTPNAKHLTDTYVRTQISVVSERLKHGSMARLDKKITASSWLYMRALTLAVKFWWGLNILNSTKIVATYFLAQFLGPRQNAGHQTKGMCWIFGAILHEVAIIH